MPSSHAFCIKHFIDNFVIVQGLIKTLGTFIRSFDKDGRLELQVGINITSLIIH